MNNEIRRIENKYAESHNDFNAKVFLSFGGLEPKDAIEDLRYFDNQLKSHYSNIQTKFKTDFNSINLKEFKPYKKDSETEFIAKLNNNDDFIINLNTSSVDLYYLKNNFILFNKAQSAIEYAESVFPYLPEISVINPKFHISTRVFDVDGSILWENGD